MTHDPEWTPDALLACWRPQHATAAAELLRPLPAAAWRAPLIPLRQQQLDDPDDEARHGADALRDLMAWAAYEEAHPDTFAAMYQFWCAPG